VNDAIDQWQHRQSAYVSTKGRHVFEHHLGV